MTRQKAVWHANHVFNIVIERCINAQNLKEAREFDEAKQIVIEALQQEPKWIPVTERLPKAGEYVGDVAKYYLVQNEYGDMLVARYTHSEYWEQIYQLKPCADEIVAWMPLPEPYEESDGE